MFLHWVFHTFTAKWEYQPMAGMRFTTGIDFSTFQKVEFVQALFKCDICRNTQWQRVRIQNV